MIEEIKKNKGRIILNKEIKNLDQLKSFDKIIFTGASPLFIKIAPKLFLTYKQKLNKIKYIGTVSILLFLKRSLIDWAYWLNINQMDIPFMVCVQQSNLINPKFYDHLHPVYLGIYTSRDSNLFKENPKKIVNKWIKYLVKINKDFKPQWIKDYKVFKEPFAQPLFKAGDYKHISAFKTPLENLYLVNMTQTYPYDRGVNHAVDISKKFVLEYF